MADTIYNVQGDPNVLSENTSDEVFSSGEMEAIQTVSDNIDAIVNVAINGQGWADGAYDSATAASSSATLAAASATSAAAEADSITDDVTAAAASATDAAASANAAATSALDAATSASHAQASADLAAGAAALPAGGSTGQAYRKNSNSDYDATWKDDPPQKFLQLADVDPAGVGPTSGNGLQPAWNTTKQKLEFVSPGASTNINSLSDVEISDPQDGDRLTYELTTSLWKNKPPTPGLSGVVAKTAPILGPTGGTPPLYSSTQAGALVPMDCTDGYIHFWFDDSVIHDDNTVIETLFNVMNTTTLNKVQFHGGPSTGPRPVILSVQSAVLTSAVAGTPAANAANVNKTITVPAGLNRCCYVLYGVNPANTNNPSECLNYDLFGTNTSWQQSIKASNAGPRLFFAARTIADSFAGTTTVFLPHWTDYGGNGNVNSYIAIFVFVGEVEPSAAYGNYLAHQTPTAGLTDTVAVSTALNEGNRIGVAACFRRGNVGGDANAITATGSGITQQVEVKSGTNADLGEMRACVVTRNMQSDQSSNVVFNLHTSAPYSDIAFTMTPVNGRMLVVGTGGAINPIIPNDGLVGTIYDRHAQRVDVAI